MPDSTSRGLKLVLAAAAYAASNHSGQPRKDAAKSPYINHPLSAASILAVEGGVEDDQILAAALLHDVLEDCVGVPPEDPRFVAMKEALAQDIKARFGAIVLGLVQEVTDDKTASKAERKRRQEEHAGTASPGAKLVKLADKIANLRDILASPPAEWTTERKQEYFTWAKQVVDRMRGVHAGLERIFDEVWQAGKELT